MDDTQININNKFVVRALDSRLKAIPDEIAEKLKEIEALQQEERELKSARRKLVAGELLKDDEPPDHSEHVAEDAANKPLPVAKNAGYNPQWSWPEKAKYVLSVSRKGMKMRQILLAIYKADPVLNAERDVEGMGRKHSGVLSPQLNNAAKSKWADIIREKNPNSGEYTYFLREWMDAKGEIPAEYWEKN